MKSAIKELVLHVCQHLQITPKQLRAIEDAVGTLPTISQRAEAFASHLHDLEYEGERRALILAFLSQRVPSLPTPEPVPQNDARYVSLYYTITQFYRKPWRDVTRDPNALIEALFPVCGRCNGEKRHTPKGFVCDACADAALRPKTDVPWADAEPADSGTSVATMLQALRKSEFSADERKPVAASVEPLEAPSKPLVMLPSDDPEQTKALRNILKWFKDGARSKQVYRLFGYAGTGKTTMARIIAQEVEDLGGNVVMFGAFAGKAASVMRAKGCTGADTLHSLIYRPQRDPETGRIIGQVVNRDSPLATAALLIVDEVSMVNEEMAMDLLSFGVKILVLGDPFQLKPVQGTGFFMSDEPDTLLTRIHRNAKDNPIIYLATMVRNRKMPKPGRYGETLILDADAEITDKQVLMSDVILCGTNRTRKRFNWRARELAGRYDPHDEATLFPVKGDTLMCLKNNRDLGLYNGTLWTCTQPQFRNIIAPNDKRKPENGSYDTKLMGLHFKVRSHDFKDASGKPLIVNTVCSAHLFDTSLPEPNWRDVAACDEWDFGYAFTVHKAQGSQWDRTLILDESDVFSDQRYEHFYTALTRTAQSAVVRLS